MGVRLSAYAFDNSEFDALLDKSVAEILFYIADHAQGDPLVFFAWQRPPYPRYDIRLKSREVVRFDGASGSSTVLSRALAKAESVLNLSLRQYLNADYADDLLFLFDSLAACPEITWVRRIINSIRTDWIFQMLNAAKKVIDPGGLKQMEQMCAKILGHKDWYYRDTEYVLQRPEPIQFDPSVSISPKQNEGQTSVFSSQECEQWKQLISRILVQVSVFEMFPTNSGIRRTDEEFDSYMRTILSSFVVLGELQSSSLRMLTTLG